MYLFLKTYVSQLQDLHSLCFLHRGSITVSAFANPSTDSGRQEYIKIGFPWIIISVLRDAFFSVHVDINLRKQRLKIKLIIPLFSRFACAVPSDLVIFALMCSRLFLRSKYFPPFPVNGKTSQVQYQYQTMKWVWSPENKFDASLLDLVDWKGEQFQVIGNRRFQFIK